MFSVCWKKSGSQLLVGGDSLSLWDSPLATAKRDISLPTVGMKMVWSCGYVLTSIFTCEHRFLGVLTIVRLHVPLFNAIHKNINTLSCAVMIYYV